LDIVKKIWALLRKFFAAPVVPSWLRACSWHGRSCFLPTSHRKLEKKCVSWYCAWLSAGDLRCVYLQSAAKYVLIGSAVLRFYSEHFQFVPVVASLTCAVRWCFCTYRLISLLTVNVAHMFLFVYMSHLS